MSRRRTAPTWSDWRTTWPGRPGWPGIEWSAAIWIVFLGVDTLFLLRSQAPPWLKVLGTSGIVAFTVIYVIEASIIATGQARSRLTPQSTLRQELAPTIRPLALMTATAAWATIAVTWYWVFFLPYFCAIVLFATRLRTGLTICGALCALVLVSSVVGSQLGDQQVFFLGVGCTMSSGFVVLARFNAERELAQDRQSRAEAAAAEREEISRDVHDILGHSLTVLTLKAEVAQRLLHQDPQAAEKELTEVIELSRSALADVRATVTRLRTPDLASQVESSRTAFTAAQIDAHFSGSAEQVPLGDRELVSWALREATTNILRHAAATRVQVVIAPGRLRVLDDGRGLEGRGAGNGLRGLRQRVEAAGGELHLVSPAPSEGRAGGRSGPGTMMEVVL